MAAHMPHILRGDWERVADLLLQGARKVAEAGADFAICPDNTYHEAFPHLLPRSPLPWLHIAEVVAEEAAGRGFRRLGVLGTKYLTEGPVYVEALKKFGVAREIRPARRERINTVLQGTRQRPFNVGSRLNFNE